MPKQGRIPKYNLRLLFGGIPSKDRLQLDLLQLDLVQEDTCLRVLKPESSENRPRRDSFVAKSSQLRDGTPKCQADFANYRCPSSPFSG